MQKPIIRPLPCPRCGTPYALSILRLDISDRWRVECEACGCAGPDGETPDEALELWNKRED